MLINFLNYTEITQSTHAEEISSDIQVLKQLEAKTPIIRKRNEPLVFSDLQTEQNKILAISEEGFDKNQAHSWFTDSVILGDSVTSATAEYGFLGTDIVYAHIGANLLFADDQFNAAKARFPSMVFLCFGLNDLEIFKSNTNLFLQTYINRVNELRAALPDTTIYIEAVFPIQPEFISRIDGAAYQPDYNTALKQYCDQTENVYFIDSTFILENMPELYDGDGEHPTSSFYPKWLTYMADVTGLSGLET